MAKKKTQNDFSSLMGSGTVNSIENDKQKNVENISRKIESISKTLSSDRIKKLFKNATSINKFVEKMKDNKSEIKATDKDNKVTKIDKLETGEESMLNILTKILTFMQKNYDEDKLAMEQARNFAEENKLEKDKKQQELLEELKKRKGILEPKTEKEEEQNLLDKFGGLGSTLLNIAKFFTTTPLGIAILGATTLMALLATDKNPEETNQMIQNAGKADGGLAEAITNIEGADKRRAKILRSAYESGELKQQGAWYSFSGRKKEAEQEKKYLEELGFDPKTGLTDADRDKGYNFVDPETGEASYSKFFDKSGNVKSKEDTAKELEAGSEPPKAESKEPAAVPAEVPPNLGSKLADVTGENLDTKMLDDLQPQLQNLMNSASNSISSVVKNLNTMIPHVRNQEETFQQIILKNTRVV